MFDKLKNLKPSFIVDTLFGIRKQIQKDFNIEEVKIKDEHIVKALELINDSKIPKNNIGKA